jgi:hypothetical protein
VQTACIPVRSTHVQSSAVSKRVPKVAFTAYSSRSINKAKSPKLLRHTYVF